MIEQPGWSSHRSLVVDMRAGDDPVGGDDAPALGRKVADCRGNPHGLRPNVLMAAAADDLA
jgi:hypothetical protein